ncbi:nicotinate-nucleotide--dimethylbenzimidazole phosphoribosyltransferase [Streptomyces sp. NPDC006355]|uniref:nicotinate-nucleotide--dimethylbenzimidazole phosphoribosyltransferase n=1 Tax=Streptomyces sp. NPDC006355 TaxID=3156758 RepID=UPI0033AF598A
MTDTGQVPGEGLPENAGMVDQPGAPAQGAYAYLSDNTAEDEDLLLLPGAQGAWGNEVPPPAPEPVVEAVHEPGPHEISGRDSGSVDLSGVRLPDPPPIPPITPRRPLHLGPPLPDSSASPVRSLADRGPADAPVRQPAAPSAGPEYLDVPRAPEPPSAPATPWGAQVAPPAQVSAGVAPAETVVPAAQPVGAAQAVVARVAQEAVQGAHAEQPAQTAATAAEPAGDQPAAAGPGQAVPPQGAATEDEAAGATATPDAGQVPAAGAGQSEAVPGASAGVAAAADAGEVAVAGAGQSEAVAGASAGVAAAADAGQVAVAGAGQGDAVAGGPAGVGAAADAGQVAATEPEQAVAQVPDAVPAEAVAQAPEAVAAETVAQAPEAAAQDAVAQAPDAVSPDADTQTPDVAAPAADAAAADAVTESLAEAGPEAAAQVPDAAAPEAAAPAPAPAVAPDAATPAASPDAAAPAAEPETAVPAVEPEAAVPAVSPETAAPAGPMPAPEAAAQQPDAAGGEAAPQTPEAPTPTDAEAAPQCPEVTAPQPAMPTSEASAPEAPAPAAEPVGPEAVPPAVEPVTQEAVATPAEAPTSTEAPAPADAPAPTEAVAPTDTPETTAPATPDSPAEAPAPAQAPEPPAPTPVAEAPADAPAEAGQETPADTAPASSEDVTVVLPAPTAEEHGAGPVQGPQQSRSAQPGAPEPSAQPGAPEPPAPVATVPAPRDGDAELAQNADDLDTRAADQDDLADQDHHRGESAAAVAEARQSSGPAAPGYDPAEREAVLKVMRERRDIRNGFRSDPIPHEVLLRVLEAAHHAPSVGHSQPWDFVVIRSADTRRAMHELAMRQRDAYAKSLPKGRAKQFKELKIEAILDTPVNIVVTADPTRGGRHTLGRHTQPQMAPYSAALAVENLWLAARAEGLGVGWVSFFDEREMVRALGLPEHLEVIAYLCVGYVDEFPDEPELLQAGWSKRRPLSWVVHEETYGRRALPGEEPHDLLAETVAQIRPLDAKALGEAWERQKRMTKPAGALGMLEIISAQLSGLSRQCPPPIPEPAAVAIFAGDHGVHAQGVTPWPQEVTAQMVANFLGGGAVCNAFATQVGAEVCIVDVGVAADLPATPGLLPRKIRGGTSDMTTGPAMTREEAKQAIEVGIDTARDLVAAGNKALLTGEMGIGNTTASAALIAVFTGADPAEVTGRGTGINDETLARKTEVVRRALELHQPDPADPIGVLAAIGGFEHAAIVGLLLGGASLRTPVILDGVSAGAAALVARAIAPEVLAACIAGHRSAEPGHVAALNKLGLRPLVDLDLRLGEGTGALLALPLVQSTARAMHEVATFDSAGVTEK